VVFLEALVLVTVAHLPVLTECAEME